MSQNPEKYVPPPDPMMEELRQIRDEIGQTISTMTSEERIRFFNDQAQQAMALIGYRLQPHPSLRNHLVSVPLDQTAD